MSLDTVTLEDALRLLTLPRTLGELDGEPVTVQNGRYGPYVKKGTDSRSLEDEEQLFTLTLAEAKELFAQPKARGRGRAAAAPPLRELGDDPASEPPIVVKEGRWGPYVTDGETNASLRQGDAVESITLQRAAELLAERRAAGPRARRAAAGRPGPGRPSPAGPRHRAPRRAARASGPRHGGQVLGSQQGRLGTRPAAGARSLAAPRAVPRISAARIGAPHDVPAALSPSRAAAIGASSAWPDRRWTRPASTAHDHRLSLVRQVRTFAQAGRMRRPARYPSAVNFRFPWESGQQCAVHQAVPAAVDRHVAVQPGGLAEPARADHARADPGRAAGSPRRARRSAASG